MTAAASVADADSIPIVQGGVNKKSAWSLFKSTLKTYFDTLYATVAQANATHTGDATGATALTLATVNANVGSFTNASITVNAKGLVTAASSGSAQPRSIYMDSGDQSTTSNVAANITELVFSVAANTRYFVRGHIHLGCNNTGGVKIAVTVPAGATLYNALTGRSATTTPANVAIGAVVTSATLSTPAFIVANNANGWVEIQGEFSIAGTSGNVQFQFASGTDTQTSTVYQIGTQISVIELP